MSADLKQAATDLKKAAGDVLLSIAPSDSDWPCAVCRGAGWTVSATFTGDATCETCAGKGRVDGLVASFPGVLTPEPIVRVVLFGRFVRLCASEQHARLLTMLDRIDTYGVRRAGGLGVLVMIAGPRDTPQAAQEALDAHWAPFVAAGIIPG